MCNRIYAFAHVIACALEHQTPVWNLAFEEYAEHFVTTSQDLLCRYPAKSSSWPRDRAARDRLGRLVRRLAKALTDGRLKRFEGGRLRVVRSGYISTLDDPDGVFRLDAPSFTSTLRQSQLVLFDGPLFRDRVNFKKYAQQLRDYFTPLSLYREHVTNCMQAVRRTADTVVGVHIRKGDDYANFRQGRHYLWPPQFLPVMHCLEAQLTGRRVAFLICSNEAQRREDFANFNVHFGPGHPVEDLYALAQCDYVVGPPSTYSAWASFYGQVPHFMISDLNHQPALSEFAVNCG